MPISDFKHSGPPVSEADLDTLERDLHVKLSQPYRAFLLRTNGGSPYPEDAFHSCFREEFGSLMHMFYAVHHEQEDLTLAMNRLQLADRIPADLLPIGCDAGDNQICIGVKGENHGRIYFWDTEFEVPPKRKPWRRNVHLIADSFDDFLATFYNSEDIELDDE